MNKRLNFYCSTMLGIMLVIMMYTLYVTGEMFGRAWATTDIIYEAKEKVEKDKNYAKTAEYKQIMQHDKDVQMRGNMTNISLGVDLNSNPILVKNEKTGKQEKVWVTALDVVSAMPSMLQTTKNITFFGLIVLSVMMLVFSFKLILHFRNVENIFSLENLKLIKKLAYTTLAFYLLFWATTFVEVYYASKAFELQGRTIDYISSIDMPNGLFEVPLLFIIYEVFAIGVRMREENQLTV